MKRSWLYVSIKTLTNGVVIYSPESCWGTNTSKCTPSGNWREEERKDSLQFVVADIRFAADAQHAEKERGKDDLDAKKKPRGPEENLANLIKRPEAAGCPTPGDANASDQASEKNNAPQ